MKTKYVEPKSYMSKEMEKAFKEATKKQKATNQQKKATPKKKGK